MTPTITWLTDHSSHTHTDQDKDTVDEVHNCQLIKPYQGQGGQRRKVDMVDKLDKVNKDKDVKYHILSSQPLNL